MKFIYDAPALLYKDALIVGDTHFGIENKLRSKGIYDEHFSMRLFEKLKGLLTSYKAKKLILLGDVKEDITTLDRTTEGILAKLSMLCEVIIAKGNHDGGIERCANAKIVPAEGFVYERIGLTHGNAWPAPELMQAEYLVMGHQHPMIALDSKLGRRRSEAVWIMAEANEKKLLKKYPHANTSIKLILMPAFNPLVGAVINPVPNSDVKMHLGPILNNKIFKLEHALIFRLDGTGLGKLPNTDVK